MLYLTYKTKDGSVGAPLAIEGNYDLEMYLHTGNFSYPDVGLTPPNLSEKQLKILKPNGIVDPDMQRFYAAEPENKNDNSIVKTRNQYFLILTFLSIKSFTQSVAEYPKYMIIILQH